MNPELRDLSTTFEDTEFGHIVKISVTCGDGTVRDLWLTRLQALHFANQVANHYVELAE